MTILLVLLLAQEPASVRFAAVEARYRAELAQDPQRAGIHIALGELYLQAADPVRALAEFEAELKVAPDSAQALTRIGAILLDRGDVPEALTRLRAADKRKPDMPETMFELGRAEALSGSLPEAAAHFAKVIAVDDRSTFGKSARYQRALVLRRLGRVAEADDEMKRFRGNK